MAFMNQEKKKLIAAALKDAMKGTGITYTLGVNHHSTLVMNIKSGPVDFITNAEVVAHAVEYSKGALIFTLWND